MIEDRRSGKFVERLSLFVVAVAAIGAFLVLLDPKATLEFSGQSLAFGGEGFSAELKGAVITIMLIGGWTAAIKHWLDDTESGKKQQESMSRIAEQSAPTTAAAVAAAVMPAANGAPAVTAAPQNPATGNIPAAETAPAPAEVKPTKEQP